MKDHAVAQAESLFPGGGSTKNIVPFHEVHGMGVKLAGKGTSLAGGALLKVVTKQLLPHALKGLMIKKSDLPMTQVENMVKECLKNPTKCKLTPAKLSQLMKKTSKTLVPKMMSAHTGMSGSGIIKAAKKGLERVQDKLADALIHGAKLYLNAGAKERGLKPFFKMSGKGLKLAGDGLFDDFKKSFKKLGHSISKGAKSVGKFLSKNKGLIKSGLDAAALAATALGQPEIAAPLGIAGQVADVIP
jgi:hypothetical protein